HVLALAAFAADLDRQVDNAAEVLQRHLSLQTLQVAGRQLGQMLAEVDHAQLIDVVPLEAGIESDDPRSGLYEVVGDRLQQRLRKLHLPGLRFVEQRNEIDVVFGRCLADILVPRSDQQSQLLQSRADRGEVIRAV